MVRESEAYFIKEIDIPCEPDNINCQAQEKGFFKRLLEKETDNIKRQWFRFFEAIAEQELENASERLTAFREKLISFNEQSRQFR